MRSTIIVLAILLTSLGARAQYTMTGKIEFERKVNVHAQLAEMEGMEWLDKLKAQMPKFNSTYFDLIFDTARSIYKPGREPETPNPFKMFGGGPATENTVYTDFNAKRLKANKAVFEQKFFVQDSMRVMEWKTKDEIRTIAGYKCNKAVGVICDSVYVVAFYTEDIPVSGGPEMFGGLPGMIMELAIPRLHTTWTANKLDIVAPKDADFAMQEKGKKVNEKELYESVRESFKNFEKLAPRNTWWTVL